MLSQSDKEMLAAADCFGWPLLAAVDFGWDRPACFCWLALDPARPGVVLVFENGGWNELKRT